MHSGPSGHWFLNVRLVPSVGDGAVRPKRDLDHHLALCQAFTLSRRNKSTVAMLKEDHWCYLPVIAFGLAQPPDFFREGQSLLKWVGSQDTAKLVASTSSAVRLLRDSCVLDLGFCILD